jgi:hypothetical protein
MQGLTKAYHVSKCVYQLEFLESSVSLVTKDGVLVYLLKCWQVIDDNRPVSAENMGNNAVHCKRRR